MRPVTKPILHEFLKGEAEEAGIQFDEGFEDEGKKERDRKAYEKLRLIKEVKKLKNNKETETTQVAEEVFEEVPMEEEPMMEEKPKRGLMAREEM